MAQGIYPYFRAIETDQDAVVKIDGRDILMLGSNNYLGLTNHPKVKEAAIDAVRRFGAGCAGSRFLNGTLSIHKECEDRLAEFLHKESVLLFTTGYQANVGTIATLVERNTWIIADALSHASIIDAARLSFGRVAKFKHNDLQDLERLLQVHQGRDVMVVTEGVFSMEGDTADLPEIVKLCQKYDVDLLLDDAHGVGVYGSHGEGTAGHFGLNDETDIIVGTFSKSLAAIGGFVAASEEIVHFLKHHARALIFSASPPPATVGAVLAALKIIVEEPERRELLWRNAEYLRDGLKSLGLDTGHSNSPIIPVVVGDATSAFQVCKMMQDEGVFINPVIPPAVQPGQSLIRFSVMSTHTTDQLDFALDKIGKISKLIPFRAEASHPHSSPNGIRPESSEEVPSLPLENPGR
ncbi:MAG: aminotransferase class I/II-fold pyridoxal phosphate-dependent enzyme [Calditrichaeota bacterium]|nr:aminotransferase class I/II-fold pyridoxal phosphate-dependent enzyme [Calditrichota bacterium]MCB9366479.1 aminotransferase class I/II-fold pyridoxal phosphate-dependent enzyme [Calditrichota bacterium]MCB9391263.1 aminotransferase class I/II-fold pyridoxal phosphate-dependent enzyme [Calditrichota bacterium]